LFLKHGYGATSVREIAEAAGVAVQTIYNAFEGKSAIMARIADMAIVGDDEPVALVDRPHVQAIRQCTDATDMVWQWASLCRGIFTRVLPLLPILAEAAAADAAVRARWRNNAVTNRYEETKVFVTHLATLVELREGLDIERATDLIWTYASFQTAEALIIERGWTPDDYETWTAQAICRILGID
jgi:AcrR family transcriptional regulator